MGRFDEKKKTADFLLGVTVGAFAAMVGIAVFALVKQANNETSAPKDMIAVTAEDYEELLRTRDEKNAEYLDQVVHAVCLDEEYRQDVQEGTAIIFSQDGIAPVQPGIKWGLEQYMKHWRSLKLESEEYREADYVITIEQGGKASSEWEVYGDWIYPDE